MNIKTLPSEMNSFSERIFNINSEEDFNKLCMNLFDFQMENNPIYSAYAKIILKQKNPNNINEIPFLPINFFKTDQIICTGKKTEEIFLSSGTTGNQSKHLISDLEIYKKSFQKSFDQFYGNISEYCILSLLPNYRERQGSSLIYMVDDLIKNSQHPKSGFYLNNYKGLSSTLEELEKTGQKTILIGVSYALLDLAKEELHKMLKNAFLLNKIHSEYGMTELLSQSYSKGDNIFKSPPWMKILIRDVNDPLTIIGNNKTGGINVIDLANIYSCPFIATQDLGKTFDDGSFSVLGRFDNSDVRGCNLLIQ
ncbi:MAG: acyl transferase [Flavobacteriales bacterium]